MPNLDTSHLLLENPERCSSTRTTYLQYNDEYLSKSIEYQDYLNCRGHDPKTVHHTFEKNNKITRNDSRKKTVNNNINNNRVIFSINPRGPNVTKKVKGNFHLLQNNEILKV